MTGRTPILSILAVVLPPAGWFAVQQAAGGVVYFACDAGGRAAGLSLAVVGAAACLWAGGFGWRRVKAATSPDAGFAARLTLGLAAIFVLADVVTLAAVWLIPPCAR